jgi:hypothetical protein
VTRLRSIARLFGGSGVVAAFLGARKWGGKDLRFYLVGTEEVREGRDLRFYLAEGEELRGKDLRCYFGARSRR